MFLNILISQTLPKKSNPVHTYSIIAYDQDTGEFGVAGPESLVFNWIFSALGEIWCGGCSDTIICKVEYGPDGGAYGRGKSAKEALALLIDKDEGRDVRQVAMIDNKGNVAAHTGKNCIYAAGHKWKKNYSVQANLMEKRIRLDCYGKGI